MIPMINSYEGNPYARLVEMAKSGPEGWRHKGYADASG